MLIARAAEAEIRRKGKIVEKIRVRKGYRNEQLDSSIRKKRTRLEARLISEARRAGVRTPAIIDTDTFSIRMEYLKGRRLKDLPAISTAMRENRRFSASQKSVIAEMFREIGEAVAKLHDAGIIHGDLTTSNMLYAEGVYFIDFGLGFRSQRAEDKATDLYLLKEVLESTHPGIAGSAWKAILKVYREKSKDGRNVVKALEKIQKRRRYLQRV